MKIKLDKQLILENVLKSIGNGGIEGVKVGSAIGGLVLGGQALVNNLENDEMSDEMSNHQNIVSSIGSGALGGATIGASAGTILGGTVGIVNKLNKINKR